MYGKFATENACRDLKEPDGDENSYFSYKKSQNLAFFEDAKGNCVIYLLVQVFSFFPIPQEVATLRHGD